MNGSRLSSPHRWYLVGQKEGTVVTEATVGTLVAVGGLTLESWGIDGNLPLGGTCIGLKEGTAFTCVMGGMVGFGGRVILKPHCSKRLMDLMRSQC